MTLARMAVAWVLVNPAVTSAIVGIRRPAHVTGILAATERRLDDDTIAAIDAVLNETGAVRATAQ
jgi:aryl-alcohol dehydrogenase-like predicted oxidoreductase